ncbi:MAG TPA: SDR family NAD(P)-dependent oxidoreductase [Verrucomicrobiae bacterium]|nr:SDR family NAD(P)-dependent oxidoreductase [Verrucomicrobiae bacterium]
MNKIDLNGKKAVVTGGARGIGYTIAERLLESGASCSLWDRDPDRLAHAVKSLSNRGEIHTAVVDISKAGSVDAAAEATFKHFGSIDILVNNAGIPGVTTKTWEIPPDDWRTVIEVNLLGPYHCCRAVVPKMLEKKYGRIVSIASIAGKEGNPNASHYSASKAGVIALTKSLGKELAQSGVIVNCVTPAVIQTEILDTVPQSHIDYMLSKIPMGRFGRKEEAAALVAWLCSEDCSFTTGAVFDLSGGRATY